MLYKNIEQVIFLRLWISFCTDNGLGKTLIGKKLLTGTNAEQ